MAAYLRHLLREDFAADNYNASDSEDEHFISLPEDESQDSEISEHEETGDRKSEADDVSENNDELVEREGSKEPSESTTIFVSKDKTIWSRTSPAQHPTTVRNIIRQRSGHHRKPKMLSICNTFKSVFTVKMVNIIFRYTNKKAITVYHAQNEEISTKKQLVWKDFTLQEFYAFLGILITSGGNNSNTDHALDISNMYDTSKIVSNL